jgi:hypothetical protein
VTPGTYEWTWGTGANQNFTLHIVAPAAVPEPGTLSLLGLGALGLWGSRRRALKAARSHPTITVSSAIGGL